MFKRQASVQLLVLLTYTKLQRVSSHQLIATVSFCRKHFQKCVVVTISDVSASATCQISSNFAVFHDQRSQRFKSQPGRLKTLVDALLDFDLRLKPLPSVQLYHELPSIKLKYINTHCFISTKKLTKNF